MSELRVFIADDVMPADLLNATVAVPLDTVTV